MKGQKEDPSLQHAWDKARGTNLGGGGGNCPQGAQFMGGGLLYCQDPGTKSHAPLQLLIPSAFRWTVLQLAHNSLLAGHLGAERMLGRVVQSFYWPGIHTQLFRYC